MGQKGEWMVNVYAHLKAILFKQIHPHMTAFGLCVSKNQLPKPCSSALRVCAKLNSTLSHWDKSGTALLKSGKLPLGSENTNESRRETVPSNTTVYVVRQKWVHTILAWFISVSLWLYIAAMAWKLTSSQQHVARWCTGYYSVLGMNTQYRSLMNTRALSVFAESSLAFAHK